MQNGSYMSGEIRVENVVASARIAEQLDLMKLNVVLSDSEYNPDKFPGLVVHLDKPSVAALMFKSGKMVVTGAKDVADAQQAVNRVCTTLLDGGQDVYDDVSLDVQNIVASARVAEHLNLINVAQALGLETIEYEPEQFPGLVYRMADVGVVLLLFGSGKVVCTGARSMEQLHTAIQTLTRELQKWQLI